MLLRSDSSYGLDTATTAAGGATVTSLPGALATTWRRHPERLVLRAVVAGHEQAWHGGALLRRIAEVAAGLRSHGFGPGDRLGILARPSPTWLIVDCACQALGGISVPLFPNAHPDTLAAIATHAGLQWCLVCGDDAAAAAEPILDHVERVVGHLVPDRLGAYPLSHLISRAGSDAEEALARDLAARQRAEAATIIYTSGSTGEPKGVVLTHGNLLSQMAAARQVFPLDPAYDRALSALPWAHVFERMVTATYLWQGIPVGIAEDVRRLGDDLRRLRPTVMTVVPRLLEKLRARIHANAGTAAGLRGIIARRALSAAESRRGAPPPVRALADALVYRQVRRRLGGRLHTVICGGAALPIAVERFFHHLGIAVQSGYGLTEAAPVVAVNHAGAHRCGSVGRAFPGVELRFSAAGEILVRSPGVMRGYFRDAAATAAVIDRDGWLHTGDLGHLDHDGFLHIAGRCKDLMKTAYGKYVAPTPIEQALCGHPLIDQAVVVADGRPCVVALLFLDPEAAGSVSAVERELAAHVEACNRGLERWCQVRHWRVLPGPLSVADGSLTPTLKIRRREILRRHAAAIEALYRDIATPEPEEVA